MARMVVTGLVSCTRYAVGLCCFGSAAMTTVLKNVDAAQNFLGGMRTLSSYGPLEEKQAKGMLRCIEKAQTMAQRRPGPLRS